MQERFKEIATTNARNNRTITNVFNAEFKKIQDRTYMMEQCMRKITAAGDFGSAAGPEPVRAAGLDDNLKDYVTESEDDGDVAAPDNTSGKRPLASKDKSLKKRARGNSLPEWADYNTARQLLNLPVMGQAAPLLVQVDANKGKEIVANI
jgi:hypothetical protein